MAFIVEADAFDRSFERIEHGSTTRNINSADTVDAVDLNFTIEENIFCILQASTKFLL